jgi:hypothetical protein
VTDHFDRMRGEHDRRQAEFSREFDRAGRFIRRTMYAAVTFAVAIAVVGLWAVVRLVLHFT